MKNLLLSTLLVLVAAPCFAFVKKVARCETLDPSDLTVVEVLKTPKGHSANTEMGEKGYFSLPLKVAVKGKVRHFTGQSPTGESMKLEITATPIKVSGKMMKVGRITLGETYQSEPMACQITN